MLETSAAKPRSAQRSAGSTEHGYFGNTPRVFSPTRFLHLNYGGRTVRSWCSGIATGEEQHRGPNIFFSHPRRTFACRYRNLHTISQPHHQNIMSASGRYRNAEFRPTAEMLFAPPFAKQSQEVLYFQLNCRIAARRQGVDSLG